MGDMNLLNQDPLGVNETRRVLTGQIIRMLDLGSKDKIKKMKEHLNDCSLMMVVNFRDSLLGYTGKLFAEGYDGRMPSQ